MAQTPREKNPGPAYFPAHGTQARTLRTDKASCRDRPETTGQSSATRKPIDDMKHVEAVLHVLEPDFNAGAISIKRRNNPNCCSSAGMSSGER
ncbi:hypothetical protein MPLSOD_260082 [Mesorhizobium sp. SOD10]|nr:hypothetical protein MPLSOD_260082 [Mesorhizobium sp. SOD10]